MISLFTKGWQAGSDPQLYRISFGAKKFRGWLADQPGRRKSLLSQT
jgi:hypothetical protein